MHSLVVFFALAAVAYGSIIPLAQPAHHPALVLDPHGRPLDTAEVINARAIHLQAKALEPVGHAAYAPLAHAAVVAAPIAHSAIVAPAVVAAPAAAVSHQSRVDVRTSPAIVAHAAPVVAAAPVLGAHSLAAPWLGHSAHGLVAHGLAGHGHYLKKRSLGHIAYSAPILAPSAVSHQSRVDVISSPAIVSHAVAAPVLSHAVAAPVVAHAIAPAAVSHQSRVDVRTSPAITVAAVAPVAHSVVAATPLISAHSYASPLLGYSAHGLSHLIKRRSLGHLVYSAPVVAPAAVSHQSRVDVISSPAIVSHAVATPVFSHAVAAPIVAHAVAPAAVSHQSRVDVRTSPAITVAAVAPVAHSVVAASPLIHSAPLAHGAGHLVHSW
ncbi:cuticle protein LPCP-23-like [Vanessa atalanta]|uniref:cuticle protein LPCP-23-like n=1 Tax=Vanessa atalanta TaxID=42275 RepID=UPI001FCDEAED|nr:cuticle protein LPCP-23-like [Vanessa atalanta]